jgi:type VI secretion system secreted protein Hcp
MAIIAYLKFEGGTITVEGGSTKEGHENEIEVLSYAFSAHVGSTAGYSTGGGSVGAPIFTDVSVVSNVDKAGPNLMSSLVTANHFDTATLSVFRTGSEEPVEFMEIILSDAIVTSYSAGASSGEGEPTNNFSLAFKKIEYKFWPQNDDGTAGGEINGSYDLARGQR